MKKILLVKSSFVRLLAACPVLTVLWFSVGFVTPAAGGASTNCLNYTNFISTSGLNLTGSAKATNGLLRLTPAVDGQIGNAWLSQKQTCAGGFDTSFHFRITQLGNTFGTSRAAMELLSPCRMSVRRTRSGR